MAPRLDLFSALRTRKAAWNACSMRSFGSTSPQPATLTAAQRRKRQDPYLVAQAKARRAANLSRQEVLKAERAKAAGSPIRGVITPFVLSFDNAQPPEQSDETLRHLNYFVKQEELEKSLEHSQHLTNPQTAGSATVDPSRTKKLVEEHEQGHLNAVEALRRIVNLENSGSKDRTRANIQRCIDKFGRHNTDLTLRPKPPSTSPKPVDYIPNTKTPRAGPDTGSSEVQIGILTAKIRALANYLDTRGRKDKHNKRNLRLLVHRRAKLLQYLRRKERGGERWQLVTETLGLTEGTWKGEITL